MPQTDNTMVAQHTPRPWRCETAMGRGPHFGRHKVLGANDQLVTILSRRQEADARLIASAPDLLKALQKATDALAMQLNFHRLPGQPWEVDDQEAADLIEHLRGVIDKAEGRQP